MSKTRVTKRYQYNALCDVCGFKYKNFELKERWDGLRVCSKDFEVRNILDFYRPREPSMPIPWTNPDNQAELTWTNNTSGFTSTGTGTTIISCTYTNVDVNNDIHFNIRLTNTENNTHSSGSGGAYFSVPTTMATTNIGSGTVFSVTTGEFIGSILSVDYTHQAVRVPVWAATTDVYLINGKYRKA